VTATTDRFQKDNIPAWPQDKDCSWPFNKYVWSEPMQTVIGYSEFEFFLIWKDLHVVWRHPHYSGALKFGCGRDTMAWTVRNVTGNRYSAAQVRWALWIGEALEWCIYNDTGRYKIFLLRPIRYENEVPGCK
jgi:hypothetical protein